VRCRIGSSHTPTSQRTLAAFSGYKEPAAPRSSPLSVLGCLVLLLLPSFSSLSLPDSLPFLPAAPPPPAPQRWRLTTSQTSILPPTSTQPPSGLSRALIRFSLDRSTQLSAWSSTTMPMQGPFYQTRRHAGDARRAMSPENVPVSIGVCFGGRFR
jgi:hypothetical protein